MNPTASSAPITKADASAFKAEFIPFNRPYMTGDEIRYIVHAHEQSCLAGDGPFTQSCHTLLERMSAGRTRKALLTHSCTAALEMSALLLDIKPGDEIIMPSFTFVSTANAFVLRGGVPVFVDIRKDTLNIDETLIESAITPRTRAIVPVHYAGVGCEMDIICGIAQSHGLAVVEDAAQGLCSTYRDKPLGTIGALGAYSFHETKNVICGEGGALMINDPDHVTQAEIIREKGTDRSRFFRGHVDKYTWQSAGSSFLPGELTAAFLLAQLENAERLTRERLGLWDRYHKLLEPLERRGWISRPYVTAHCRHNGHMYQILVNAPFERNEILRDLNARGVGAVFHYVPLHLAPAGQRYGRSHGALTRTVDLSSRLIRLPMWIGLTDMQQLRIAETLERVLRSQA